MTAKREQHAYHVDKRFDRICDLCGQAFKTSQNGVDKGVRYCSKRCVRKAFGNGLRELKAANMVARQCDDVGRRLLAEKEGR